jgi:hypothetical protein
MVHNGTATVAGTADGPTFTPGDNLTLMAPFSDVTLANDGDFIDVATTLTMTDRTTTGVNSLNTQLRFALLDDGVNSTLTAGDAPNLGFTIEYSNVATGGLIREQQSATQTNPFTSPTSVGTGTQDAGGDSIQGANPGPVTFDLRLTRNAGKLDLTGSISGTDAVSGNPYLANFSVLGYTSTNFPVGGPFTFNRVGLFLGDNVNGTSASLANSSVTTGSSVPEPSCVAMVVVVGALVSARGRRKARPFGTAAKRSAVACME